jgi:hypothetical protein
VATPIGAEATWPLAVSKRTSARSTFRSPPELRAKKRSTGLSSPTQTVGVVAEPPELTESECDSPARWT